MPNVAPPDFSYHLCLHAGFRQAHTRLGGSFLCAYRAGGRSSPRILQPLHLGQVGDDMNFLHARFSYLRNK